MTDETPAETGQLDTRIPEREVEFQGRMIWVKMPSPEQILVWQRILKRLQSPEQDNNWNGETVMAALERLRKIIDSIILNRVDIEWLDDEMLDGTIGFREAAGLVTLAMKAFGDSANRADRRAAEKKPKKATRKKAG